MSPFEMRLEARCPRGEVGPGYTYLGDRPPDMSTFETFQIMAGNCKSRCNNIHGSCHQNCEVEAVVKASLIEILQAYAKSNSEQAGPPLLSN